MRENMVRGLGRHHRARLCLTAEDLILLELQGEASGRLLVVEGPNLF